MIEIPGFFYMLTKAGLLNCKGCNGYMAYETTSLKNIYFPSRIKGLYVAVYGGPVPGNLPDFCGGSCPTAPFKANYIELSDGKCKSTGITR